jgi:hypothetical protein
MSGVKVTQVTTVLEYLEDFRAIWKILGSEFV